MHAGLWPGVFCLYIMVMEKIFELLGLLGLSLIADFILALFVMCLWNYVMPSMFGVCEITWLKSLCLTFLCDLLFKPHNVNK